MTSQTKNEDKLWESYHELLLGPDAGRIKKMLVRYDLYKFTQHLEGDIFECGVFKGAGLMYWLKILSIYEPGSPKKVVGFDTFNLFNAQLTEREKQSAEEYMREAKVQTVSPEKVFAYAQAAGLRERMDLVVGDIEKTSREYLSANPETKISFLHLDLDTYYGTKGALEAFFPFVSPGGIIVFDEYGDPEWGETEAIDQYFRDKEVKIEMIPHCKKPSAYIIKK